jgi:glycerate kinase
MRVLACPASLKGVLSSTEAAARLTAGLRRVERVEAEEAPVSDGGEGFVDVLHAALGGDVHTVRVSDPLGRATEAGWLLLPDRTAVVESAQAVGLPLLDRGELDPLRATSRGLGELLLATLPYEPASLLVGVGGTATVDGGAAMRELVGDRLRDVRLRVACDVRNPLLGPDGAARVFGPQKGADESAVEELERRLASLRELEPVRDLPGAGAGGGLGAALAALGGELCEGAELVLDLIEFDRRAAAVALVVTGEGAVDRTTLAGKAPGAVARRCRRLGVRCELFGGVVRDGIEARALSGRPEHAAADLVELGETLARELASEQRRR